MRFHGHKNWLLLVAALAVLPYTSWAQNQSPPANSTTSFRIAGTVVRKTDGHPLSGARVVLASVKSRQKQEVAVTADDGKFEFTGVPAGKYSLNGGHRGFISAGYDQHDQYSSAIVTGAGVDTETLVLKLAPNALISGRVLDESGEPVRRATVMLYSDDHQGGVHQIHSSRGGQTDDLGAYELPSLSPGTYYLSATAQPWYAVHPERDPSQSEAKVDSALDVAYPITYYPDVTDSDSAAPISIRGGEHLQLDLHLSPVPSLHVIVHVPASGSNQISVPQLEQSVFGDSISSLGHSTTRSLSDGTWEVSGIAAGRYNIRVTGPSSATEITGVDLSGTQELDASAGEALCTVKVSVSRSDSMGSGVFFVGLRSKNRTIPGFTRPDSKNQFNFENVPAGRYDIQLGGPGRTYSIAQISAEGAEISGHSLILSPGASASLSLTPTLGGAEVQGTAKREGKGFPGAMIVLVPKNPAGNRDLFRRDQSDLDGTFVFHQVVPGSYNVVAIENGWDLDWSLPEIIAAYAKRGVPLQVTEKADQNLTLPNSVEVQPK
jgi:carboxypeptidase family protein